MSLFTYTFYLDTERDAAFGEGIGNISAYVQRASWAAGALSPWERVAPAAELNLVLDNSGGDFNVHDPSATYYGKLSIGTLLKITAQYGTTTETLCVLKIADDGINFIERPDGQDYQLHLRATDPMPQLLRSEYSPDLQLDVRIDQALTAIFEDAPAIWPYDSSYFFLGKSALDGSEALYDGSSLTDFEEAYTTLSFYGDNLEHEQPAHAQTAIRDLLGAEIVGLFYFQPRTQKFVFLNRWHANIASQSPYVATTSAYVFTLRDLAGYERRYGENLCNDFTLYYYPREVGAAQSALWAHTQLPLRLRYGQPQTFDVRFRDADNPSAQVGAQIVEPVQPGRDVTANQREDGTGPDETAYIEASTTWTAQSAQIVLESKSPHGNPYVQTLQILGTPLKSYQRQAANSRDADSAYAYDTRARSEVIRSIDSDEFAQQFCDFMVAGFGSPALEYRRVRLVVKNEALALQHLQRTIGDVITLVDEFDTSRDYMIVGEAHDLDPGSGLHQISWALRPVAQIAPFVLGTSALDGTDILVL